VGGKGISCGGEGKAGPGRHGEIRLDHHGPQKGLFLPYGTGAVLAKDAQRLYDSHRADASYLQDLTDAVEEPSPADLSPELTRHFELVRVLQEEGQVYLSSTTIDGKFFIRLAVLSFQTHLDEIDRTIEILLELSHRLLNS
jgi:hypothetical protein